MHIWWVTTFPDTAWPVYAQTGLQNLVRHLPPAIKLCVGLDTSDLEGQVRHLLRKHDNLTCGWQPDHQAFILRNFGRDAQKDYRLQASRFCHKVFVYNYFYELALRQPNPPEFLVWWDADAILTTAPSPEDFINILPRKNEACSYLGRKDWDHSECGFLGFNLRHEGAGAIIKFMKKYYVDDLVFGLPQWHDSFLFDIARSDQPCRNISENISGNNVWAHTALARFSEHWKGVEAKQRHKPMDDAELFEA